MKNPYASLDDLPCHCTKTTIRGKRIRIAWGIECARYVVGPSTMGEEDEADEKRGEGPSEALR